jgi:AraC-like DNA-binding protein
MVVRPSFFRIRPTLPVDPLAEIVTLLRPAARFSKLVEGVGSWRVRRPATGEPFYCAVLKGRCRVTVGEQPPMRLEPGDFLLTPAMSHLLTESVGPPPDDVETTPVELGPGHFRLGRPDGAPDVRMRIGHCSFGSPDAAMLAPLLPRVVVARGDPRLLSLMQLIGDETGAARPARELVLERLLEVLLIEALRGSATDSPSPGLPRGLADERLATVLRAIHADPAHAWTVSELAGHAALSRSAFVTRFSRAVGLAPVEYLTAWRMALAKQMLAQDVGAAEVAERVGYGSASAFSVAFARHAGVPPARYARMRQAG